MSVPKVAFAAGMMVVSWLAFSAEEPETREPAGPASAPDPKVPVTATLPISRARIEVVPFVGQSRDKPMEGLFIEEFVGTQIETLRSPLLRQRTELRIKSSRSEVAPAPVTVTVVRAEGEKGSDVVAILRISASSTSPAYAALYLGSLIDEMDSLRREQFQKSLFGTMQRVNEEALEKEKQARDLKVKLDAAIKQNAPQYRLENLKSQFEKADQSYQVWSEKAHKIRTSLEKLPIRLDIRIVERPEPFKGTDK